jgi:hypothetical protein
VGPTACPAASARTRRVAPLALAFLQLRSQIEFLSFNKKGKNYPAAYLKIDSRQGSPEFDNMSQIETHYDKA